MATFRSTPGTPLPDLSRYDDVYDAIANQHTELTDPTTRQLRPEVRQAVLGLLTHYKRRLVWDLEAGDYDQVIALAIRCKLIDERLNDDGSGSNVEEDRDSDWASPTNPFALSDKKNAATSWHIGDVTAPGNARPARVDEGYASEFSVTTASPPLIPDQYEPNQAFDLPASSTATLLSPYAGPQRYLSESSTLHNPDCDTPDCIGSPHTSPCTPGSPPFRSSSIERLAAEILRQVDESDCGYSWTGQSDGENHNAASHYQISSPTLPTAAHSPAMSKTPQHTSKAPRTPLGELSINCGTPAAGFSSVRGSKERVWTPWKESGYFDEARTVSSASKAQQQTGKAPEPSAWFAGHSDGLHSCHFDVSPRADAFPSTLPRRTVSRYREFFKSMTGNEEQENVAVDEEILHDNGGAMSMCDAFEKRVKLGRDFGRPLMHLPKRQRMTSE